MPTETQHLEQRVAALQSDLNARDQAMDDAATENNERELSRRNWFEATQAAEKRVVELGGLLRGMVDAAKALKASKHGFNEQQWEQLHAAVAASDTALTPVSGGLVIGFDPGDPGGSHTAAFGENCLHEFVPFTKGCSKCGEPYSTEGTSHE
ncbi:hypothetical protein ACKWMZ_26660 [Pseudomonas protegens]|uniref:hypothetical protein n=1 Tax=Pseudomonas protegens TaxID=380021 RepID=UPI0039672458